jgi:Flp pilus assembly protein TadD
MTHDLVIGAGLILAILVIYAQTAHFDFTDYDDDVYVYKNVHVQAGLTPASIQWAFTAVVSANWMPVTLLSHLLDAQLFGMQPGMHHLVNVFFHALSSVLLFVVLRRATGAVGASAFVAFLFAVHPLHVGSVAWIAERKDVLSTFLFFLALWLYERYAESPSVGRYLQMAGIFCLGLMAKPMLVTFPFVLLLFDVWPLRRVRWPRMLWEKIPLFALSAAASVVTYLVQRSSGAVDQKATLALRLENALVCYVIYLGQMFLPVRLSVLYPFPKSIPAWQVAGACAILAGISAAALLAWQTRPYLTVGWLWYLGTLVPVIGLVQVGMQSHADRYMYIPMVGIAIMIAWGAAEWKPAIVWAAGIACLLLMVDAHAEAAYWQNSETLFQRALEVTSDNWVAERNLGGYLMDLPGRTADAIPHLEAAARLQPENADTRNNLAVCLLETGRPAESIPQFQQVVRLKPDFAKAHFNLALALSKIPGREEEAVQQYRTTVHLEPDNAVAHQSLGLLLVKLGRTEQALTQLEEAVRLNPDYSGEYNLGVVLLKMPGKQSEAVSHLEAAQRLHPDPDVAATLARLRGH